MRWVTAGEFGQVFITDTDLGRIPGMFRETGADVRVYEVKSGTVRRRMMWLQIHYLRSMERNDAKPLKAAIQQFIRAHRMQGKLDEVDVVKAWGVVFGVFVEKQTRSLRLQVDGKLWVKLDSGPLKEELMMAKGKMVDLLNEELGRPLIKEIVIQ